jgi:hypothetical protein
MEPLWEFLDFVRKVRFRARFGKRSRAPLRMLRLELSGETAECDLMARQPDPWDADLPPALRERNVSLQALEDALTVRDLLFGAVHGLREALLRVYRTSSDGEDELIIEGTVTRDDPPTREIRSLAMRAKLCGLRFSLEDGILGTMHQE